MCAVARHGPHGQPSSLVLRWVTAIHSCGAAVAQGMSKDQSEYASKRPDDYLSNYQELECSTRCLSDSI